jgi:long-chain acyl-CoA synthetase
MMHVSVEHIAFVAYLDSLLLESRARGGPPPRAELPETLNRLHAQAMREHDRPNALLFREGEEWRSTPDWRLDRQIIRLALYLRERLGIEPGERVAVISELRPEWLIADLAALGLGAVSVAIDSRLRSEELVTALEDAAPRVTFASPAAQGLLERLDGGAPPYGELVSLGPSTARIGAAPLDGWLELGGTLDTPERAQSFRALARELGPERPAIRHYRQGPVGWERLELTQGQSIGRLRALGLHEGARPGDLAYVSDPAVSPAARLALYAFLGDGYTTTALAPAGQELSDLAALHPTRIVAPAAVLADVVRAGDASAEAEPGSGGWLRRVARQAPQARARANQRAIRATLGGRARWIGSTDRLDAALAERLGSIAVVADTELNLGGAV